MENLAGKLLSATYKVWNAWIDLLHEKDSSSFHIREGAELWEGIMEQYMMGNSSLLQRDHGLFQYPLQVVLRKPGKYKEILASGNTTGQGSHRTRRSKRDNIYAPNDS